MSTSSDKYLNMSENLRDKIAEQTKHITSGDTDIEEKYTNHLNELDKLNDKIRINEIKSRAQYSQELSLPQEKERLKKRLEFHAIELESKRHMVEFKYDKFKKIFDNANITIIIISSLISILEIVQSKLSEEYLSSISVLIFEMCVIILATSIGLIAAILKFRKLQENMEKIVRTIEKIIFTQSRIKKLIEDIDFANRHKFKNIMEVYSSEISNLINESLEQVSKSLNFIEQVNYLWKFGNINKIKEHKELEIKALRKNKLLELSNIENQYEYNKMNLNNNNIIDIKQQPLELIAEEDANSSTSTDSDITENDHNEVYTL